MEHTFSEDSGKWAVTELSLDARGGGWPPKFFCIYIYIYIYVLILAIYFNKFAISPLNNIINNIIDLFKGYKKFYWSKIWNKFNKHNNKIYQ